MGAIFKQRWTRDGVTREARKWYGEYRDETGTVRRVALSPDKQAARALL